jgi:hypothetical protein
VVLIVAAAFSMPAQARVAHVKGAHIGNFSGARVAAAHRGIYRGGVWRGQHGRYAYGYRPYWGWGAAGIAAGFAASAAASAWPNNYGYTYDNNPGYAYYNYGYAYDNPYGYGGVTYQGGPRYPYYQRSFGYGSPYRNWTQF